MDYNSNIEWQWWNDSAWIPYDSVNQQKIETAYQNFPSSSKSTSYFVDIETFNPISKSMEMKRIYPMISSQTHLEKNGQENRYRVRRIRRLDLSTDEQKEKNRKVIWEYSNDYRLKWYPYDDKNQKVIESAYVTEFPDVDIFVTIPSGKLLKYRLNFKEGTQTLIKDDGNLDTNIVRPFRRSVIQGDVEKSSSSTVTSPKKPLISSSISPYTTPSKSLTSPTKSLISSSIIPSKSLMGSKEEVKEGKAEKGAKDDEVLLSRDVIWGYTSPDGYRIYPFRLSDQDKIEQKYKQALAIDAPGIGNDHKYYNFTPSSKIYFGDNIGNYMGWINSNDISLGVPYVRSVVRLEKGGVLSNNYWFYSDKGGRQNVIEPIYQEKIFDGQTTINNIFDGNPLYELQRDPDNGDVYIDSTSNPQIDTSKQLSLRTIKYEDSKFRDGIRRKISAQQMISFCESNPSVVSFERFEGSIPAQSLPKTGPRVKVIVDNLDTLVAAQQLINAGFKEIGILNLANDKRRGGGFIEGSLAQEETLFRRTNLPCLVPESVYPFSRQGNNATVLYVSPVSVYRMDELNSFIPLNPLFQVSCVFAAAQNKPPLVTLANGQRKYKNTNDEKFIRDVIEKVFYVFAKNGQKNLVLGAIGCGAFDNPANVVARIFREQVEKYKHVFETIVFAVFIVNEKDKENFKIFSDTFADFS